MNCQFINEHVIDYLDENLNRDEIARFESHLSGCNECRDLVKEIRLTYELASVPTMLKVSENFVEATVDRLFKKEAKVLPIFYRVIKPLAVAASIALGVIIGNGELTVLNNSAYNDEESVVLTITNGADFSVWQSFENDYGSEN